MSGGFTIYDDGETQLDAVSVRGTAMFMPNFGVEGEFTFGPGKEQLGSIPGVVTNLAVGVKTDYAAYGVASFPLGDRLTLFARGGYGVTEIEAEGIFAGTTTVTSASEDASGFRYGVGALLHFNDDYGIRFDAGRIEIDDEDLGVDGSLNTYSLGLFLKF